MSTSSLERLWKHLETEILLLKLTSEIAQRFFHSNFVGEAPKQVLKLSLLD